ncbi:EPIDERMAL PATTERNING FACTOR-like protein 2 isoform X2 [Phalaenopsis equestris]|uniref:EPIDERMAL PATTERNING FACTOR-like protein 2 isoform X2 n=1 Tax=Phalaenopsis equestris TaxID=78828 RepID=UPI0009E5882C|nr:EPIDERMAL PATTERNING FACTOR-like protein 2 isoform X2 [Phalaenopsis equestris]
MAAEESENEPSQRRCDPTSSYGRPLLKLSEITREEKGGEEIIDGSMIGSRPPLCVGICRACGRCEAVQVPAVPQQRNGGGRVSAAINVIRGDYSSNYKPLSWKCKCGDLIVNP